MSRVLRLVIVSTFMLALSVINIPRAHAGILTIYFVDGMGRPVGVNGMGFASVCLQPAQGTCTPAMYFANGMNVAVAMGNIVPGMNRATASIQGTSGNLPVAGFNSVVGFAPGQAVWIAVPVVPQNVGGLNGGMNMPGL